VARDVAKDLVWLGMWLGTEIRIIPTLFRGVAVIRLR
jgi:hypothetical protein